MGFRGCVVLVRSSLCWKSLAACRPRNDELNPYRVQLPAHLVAELIRHRDYLIAHLLAG